MKACCTREGNAGLFVSVRTFSQELKDVYYDTRSFLNKGFQSERDRMEPLLKAPCLVLDDFDRSAAGGALRRRQLGLARLAAANSE